MVQPNDVADRDVLLERIRTCEMRQDMLSRALAEATALISGLTDQLRALGGEVRTRRLVVVDDTNAQRIVASANGDEASLVVRSGPYEALVAGHMIWTRHADGGSAHLLATPDDAEVHVHCDSGRPPTSSGMARATLHAMRGWRGPNPAGQASLNLAAGNTTNGWQTCG